MEFEVHKNNRVMIVDDQEDIHKDFQEILRPRLKKSTDDLAAAFLPEEDQNFLPPFELLHATTGEEACEIVAKEKEKNRPIALAYIDIRMPPGIDGVEAIRRMRKIDSDIEFVLMTAYTDMSLLDIVRDMELLHKLLYIRKPFAREEVQQISIALVEKWNMERQLEESSRQIIHSHHRLEAVLDATGEAIAMFDGKERLVFANQWYQKLLNVTEDELKRMSPSVAAARCRERLREAIIPGVKEIFAAEDGGDVVEQVISHRASENRLFYRWQKPVRDTQGGVIGNLFVYRDMSKELEVERMEAEVLRLRAELETTYSFAGMVGASAAMQKVYALMKQALKGDATILIRGESGTGKELVAKFLHFNGARKKKPFLAVNCAAVPETLIESEMFGHERGAFTGAVGRRIGCFEQAQGGTILLDEIADMQLSSQAKLLRVLQEREIQRVGGTATIPVDVRVIASTNKDLEAAMRSGEFREDLFYRIAVFPIVVPPLRERRGDIPLLADHFLKKYAASYVKSISGISSGALRLLLQYDWPGNVRELQGVIERAVLLETGKALKAGNLPLRLSTPRAASSAYAEVLPLEEVERQAIVRAMEASDNNVTQAARALGVNRSTLNRKLKKYDIPAND